MPQPIQVTTNTEKQNENQLLLYKGKVGERRNNTKVFTEHFRICLPAKDTCKIIYTETKLGSKFHVKYKSSKEHKHDLIYKAQCPDLNCDETYIGEIGRRFSERIIDHSGRDDKSHLYEHAEKTGHGNVNIDHFEILSNGYRNNKFKRKLAEALHIKHERPTLIAQEHSVSLKLFSCRSIEVQLESTIF